MIENKRVKAAGTSDLRLRLVGKALVGFDTKRWSTFNDATPAIARIGAKPGTPCIGKGPSAL